MTDKGFSREMKDVLSIANTLLQESDTEETRIYVQQKLKEMREYLQEKQAKVGITKTGVRAVGWLYWGSTTLTGKVISWRSVTHMRYLAFSHQY